MQMVPAGKGGYVFDGGDPPLLFLLGFELSGEGEVGDILVVTSALVTLSTRNGAAKPTSSLGVSGSVSLSRIIIATAGMTGKAPITCDRLAGSRLGHQGSKRNVPFLVLRSPSMVVASSTKANVNCSNFHVQKASTGHVGVAIGKMPMGSSRSRAIF